MGRPSWYSSLLLEVQGTPSWFTGLELEQHKDAQWMRSRVEAQNVQVQYGSSADQVQSTSAVFKCHCIDKRSDQVQVRSLCTIIKQGTPSWFTGLELEQHKDAQWMRSRVEAQNVQVQYGSSADQVQSTSAVFKCHCIDKRSDQVQLGMEPRSSPRAGKNRTSSAADKKRRICRSFSRTRLKMKSNQLDEETSWKPDLDKSIWYKKIELEVIKGCISADEKSSSQINPAMH
ncbi:hypothetical protein F511_20466 [Dorcoceras hygrometricum]|uniref:Uncharacterized protein n=1 Tax=Dorcoceras hygrometricum TaxID=472368 RepID=A0A2Z7API6_9LAMI|nr:hypothetical protein F511_20466 [Dorcoceras hygrometricum]